MFVVLLSALLLAGWIRQERQRPGSGLLPAKYWGLLGIAVGVLCLLQFTMLRFGLASPYAVKKYAFGLNTVLLIGLPLLAANVLRRRHAEPSVHNGGGLLLTGEAILPAALALVAVFILLPNTSSRTAATSEIVPLERFAMQYRQALPGSNAGAYDYAAGLFHGDRVIDFMISIGVLQAPQNRAPGHPLGELLGKESLTCSGKALHDHSSGQHHDNCDRRKDNADEFQRAAICHSSPQVFGPSFRPTCKAKCSPKCSCPQP